MESKLLTIAFYNIENLFDIYDDEKTTLDIIETSLSSGGYPVEKVIFPDDSAGGTEDTVSSSEESETNQDGGGGGGCFISTVVSCSMK